MSYQVNLETSAADELGKLDSAIIQWIILRINWLATNFENVKPQPLTGPLKGYYKLRIGHYRVFYTIDQPTKAILIEHIGHRRDIYKRP
jgi:mRNA interferase RelE/StbE